MEKSRSSFPLFGSAELNPGEIQKKNIENPQNLKDSTINNSANNVPHRFQFPMPSQPMTPTSIVFPTFTTNATNPFVTQNSSLGSDKKQSNKKTSIFSKSFSFNVETEAVEDEDERTLFCARGKLYKLVGKNWEDRGVGDVKLMKNKEEQVRMLLKKDQIPSICEINQLTINVELTSLPNNDQAWLWIEINHVDGILQLREIFIEFKFANEAQLFNEIFEKEKKSLQCSNISNQVSTTSKPTKSIPLIGQSVILGNRKPDDSKLTKTSSNSSHGATNIFRFGTTGTSSFNKSPEMEEFNQRKFGDILKVKKDSNPVSNSKSKLSSSIPINKESGEIVSSSVNDSISKSDWAPFSFVKENIKIPSTKLSDDLLSNPPPPTNKESSDGFLTKNSSEITNNVFRFVKPPTRSNPADIPKHNEDPNLPYSKTTIPNFDFGKKLIENSGEPGKFKFTFMDVEKKFETLQKSENLMIFRGSELPENKKTNLNETKSFTWKPPCSKNDSDFVSSSSQNFPFNIPQSKNIEKDKSSNSESPENEKKKLNGTKDFPWEDSGDKNVSDFVSNSSQNFSFNIPQSKNIEKNEDPNSKLSEKERTNLNDTRSFTWKSPGGKNDSDFVSNSSQNFSFNIPQSKNIEKDKSSNSESPENEKKKLNGTKDFPWEDSGDKNVSDFVSSSLSNSLSEITLNKKNEHNESSDSKISENENENLNDTKNFPCAYPSDNNVSDFVSSSSPNSSSDFSQSRNIEKDTSNNSELSENGGKKENDPIRFPPSNENDSDFVSSSLSNFLSKITLNKNIEDHGRFNSELPEDVEKNSNDTIKIPRTSAPGDKNDSYFVSTSSFELRNLNGMSFGSDVRDNLKEEANTLYQQKKYEQALSKYTKLIELDPSSGFFFWGRAACYMMMNQYEKALVDAKKSVEVNPNLVKGYDRLIKIALALGSLNEAEYAVTKFSKLHPMNELLDDKRKSISNIRDFIQRAEENFAEKKYDEALENIEKVVDVCTRCISYKVRKGECFALLKRYKDAESLANSILQQDKMNIDAKYILAFSQYQKDPQTALDPLKTILRLIPDHKKAVDLYKKARGFIDKKRDGNEAYEQKNYFEAHKIYDEGTKIDPCNKNMMTILYSNMAQASYKMGKVENTIDECTKALENDPMMELKVKTLMRRVKCYMDTKEYEEAIVDISKVLELDAQESYRKLLEEAKKLLKEAESNYHEILGVGKNASSEEVKKVYREKAMQYHPDRHPNASEADKRKNERKFKNITRAYRFLTEGQNARGNSRPPKSSGPNFKSQREYPDSSNTSNGAKARPSAAPSYNSNEKFSTGFSYSGGTWNFPRPDSPPFSSSQSYCSSSNTYNFPSFVNDPWSSPGRHICKCTTGCPGQCGCRKKGFVCTEICGCQGRCSTNSPTRSRQINGGYYSPTNSLYSGSNYCDSVRTRNSYSGSSVASSIRNTCGCRTRCPGQCGCRRKGLSCHSACGCGGTC